MFCYVFIYCMNPLLDYKICEGWYLVSFVHYCFLKSYVWHTVGAQLLKWITFEVNQWMCLIHLLVWSTLEKVFYSQVYHRMWHMMLIEWMNKWMSGWVLYKWFSSWLPLSASWFTFYNILMMVLIWGSNCIETFSSSFYIFTYKDLESLHRR